MSIIISANIFINLTNCICSQMTIWNSLFKPFGGQYWHAVLKGVDSSQNKLPAVCNYSCIIVSVGQKSK